MRLLCILLSALSGGVLAGYSIYEVFVRGNPFNAIWAVVLAVLVHLWAMSAQQLLLHTSKGVLLSTADPYKCPVCGHGLAYVNAPCLNKDCDAFFDGRLNG